MLDNGKSVPVKQIRTIRFTGGWITVEGMQYTRRKKQERIPPHPNQRLWTGSPAFTNEHGTHFVFPESMLRKMLPVGSQLLVSLMFKAGKEYKKECLETRIDIDRRLKQVLKEW